MSLLTQVIFLIPSRDNSFAELFFKYLSNKGEVIEDGVELTLSKKDYLPRTSFKIAENKEPLVRFSFDDGSKIEIQITNTTKTTKESPYPYSHIEIKEFIKRIKIYPILSIDHTGFNLPYFVGVHPKILALRKNLQNACLYRTFPKHLEDAPWDFIIPGTKEEIGGSQSVDYHKTRKPKIEIVSFQNSSTPLIQIDIQLRGQYEDLSNAFPEALLVPDLRNMWIYLENEFGIDICFVLNEASVNDWSHEFKNERL